jgi:AcrR family transcriptional regulator
MTVNAREAAGDERRARIVAAALEVFAERGYKGASLAQIGERVGITQQAVLYHFRSKDQLLVAALEERDRQDRQWWADTVDSAEQDLDFLEWCQRLVEHNSQRLQRVRLFTVLAADSVIDGHPAQAFFRARYARLREQLADQLAVMYERAGRRGPSVAVVLAVLDGLQLQWLLDPEGFDMVSEFRTFEVSVRETSAAEW